MLKILINTLAPLQLLTGWSSRVPRAQDAQQFLQASRLLHITINGAIVSNSSFQDKGQKCRGQSRKS